MAQATFYTPDGDEVEIDPDDVIDMSAGQDDDTTLIELEDGSEILVAASPVEAAAELGLNPLDYVDPANEDEMIERDEDDDTDL